MKFIYTTIALLIISIASAQTQKGTVNTNLVFNMGNQGGNAEISKSINSLSFNLNPNIGYFVRDNWEVGWGINFGLNRFRVKGSLFQAEQLNSWIVYGISTYSKYYFSKTKVKPFGVVSVGFNRWNSRNEVNNVLQSKTSANGVLLGAGGGVAWFPASNVGLFSQLTYNANLSDNSSRRFVGLNFGFQVNILNQKK